MHVCHDVSLMCVMVVRQDACECMYVCHDDVDAYVPRMPCRGIVYITTEAVKVENVMSMYERRDEPMIVDVCACRGIVCHMTRHRRQRVCRLMS